LVAKVRTIGDETPQIGEFSKAKYCGKPVLQREVCELFLMKHHERIGWSSAIPAKALSISPARQAWLDETGDRDGLRARQNAGEKSGRMNADAGMLHGTWGLNCAA